MISAPRQIELDCYRTMNNHLGVNIPMPKQHIIPSKREQDMQLVEELRKTQEKLYEIPNNIFVKWNLRLWSLMELAWQYIETICDLSAIMKLDELKKATQQLRLCRKQYNSYVWQGKINSNINRIAEETENRCQKPLRELCKVLNADADEQGLEGNFKLLLVAVHQALAVADAAFMYEHQCERQMREKYGIKILPDDSMIRTEFICAKGLLEFYGGDCYHEIPSREYYSKKICNMVNLVKITDEMLKD
jgi:hypothetical protein